MRQMPYFLLIASLLLGGCASPRLDVNAEYPEEQARIKQRLEEIFDAAEKKDFPRLDSYHLYSPKFTKFTPESPLRQDAVTARKGEHDGLSRINDLSMRAEELKIDVFNQAAISTFIFNYNFKAGTNKFEKKAQSTMVFVKENGEWKIAHEHFSPLDQSR
jgi:ketosteroid isomerase-like protein